MHPDRNPAWHSILFQVAPKVSPICLRRRILALPSIVYPVARSFADVDDSSVLNTGLTLTLSQTTWTILGAMICLSQSRILAASSPSAAEEAGRVRPCRPSEPVRLLAHSRWAILTCIVWTPSSTLATSECRVPTGLETHMLGKHAAAISIRGASCAAFLDNKVNVAAVSDSYASVLDRS